MPLPSLRDPNIRGILRASFSGRNSGNKTHRYGLRVCEQHKPIHSHAHASSRRHAIGERAGVLNQLVRLFVATRTPSTAFKTGAGPGITEFTEYIDSPFDRRRSQRSTQSGSSAFFFESGDTATELINDCRCAGALGHRFKKIRNVFPTGFQTGPRPCACPQHCAGRLAPSQNHARRRDPGFRPRFLRPELNRPAYRRQFEPAQSIIPPHWDSSCHSRPWQPLNQVLGQFITSWAAYAW